MEVVSIYFHDGSPFFYQRPRLFREKDVPPLPIRQAQGKSAGESRACGA